MSVDEWVELIKAIGGVVGAIIGAVGLAYARIGAKRSKEASAQTKTTQHLDGHLITRTSAESSEEALVKVEQLKGLTDSLLAQLVEFRTDIGLKPGSGTRRAIPTKETNEAL